MHPQLEHEHWCECDHRQDHEWYRIPCGGSELDGLPLFACGGCGSEWVRSQTWTPIGSDGVVPAEVAAQAALRRSTSGPSAAAAGSAGS